MSTSVGNGTNTKNVGIYDAKDKFEVIINGSVIKRKGSKSPNKTLKSGDVTVFFAEGYEDTSCFQDQLCIAFIDASKQANIQLKGVGYGHETISIEIN